MSRYMWSGAVGLVGAAITGIGEALLQMAPGADYGDPAYSYFLQIDATRASLGHWLSVLAAPLYLPGYWHLSRNLAPARPRLAIGLFLATAYAFVLATVWMGQRYFLAATVQAIAAGAASPDLLHLFATHNEPLINVLRLALLGFSVCWLWLILGGRSNYPWWIAGFSPGVLLAAIFGVYFLAPEIGEWLLPTAMNSAHVVLFALSLLALNVTRKAHL